jgi:hypothetical protein
MVLACWISIIAQKDVTLLYLTFLDHFQDIWDLTVSFHIKSSTHVIAISGYNGMTSVKNDCEVLNAILCNQDYLEGGFRG